MYTHLGIEAQRESLGEGEQEGTVTSCRKIQALEAFVEDGGI